MSCPRHRTPSLPARLVKACCAFALLALAPVAHGHGIWGHIHVTGWAIENLPDGELRDFFAHPDVRNAAHFGAAFTDSGYWPQANSDRARVYGEHTHWEPFVERFIDWIIANDPPPFTTLESRQRVAFLMGCAAHGLQDEIFDSLFLDHIHEHDGAGQDEADPATDGFLVQDELTRFLPTVWMPMDALLEIYDELDADIDEQVIRAGVTVMMTLYVSNIGLGIARGMGELHADAIPWTRAWYMDPDIPGSLRAEILPTMHYLEAIWERLHGRWSEEDLVVFAYPHTPRRLLSGDPASAGSVVSMIFGRGVHAPSMAGGLADDDGVEVDTVIRSNRWGGEGLYTRVMRVVPQAALEPGGWYDAWLDGGATVIGHGEAAVGHTHRFQVRCATDDDPACPDVGPLPAGRTDLPFVDPVDGPELPEPPDDEGAVAAGGGCTVVGSPATTPAALVVVLALLALSRRRARRSPAFVRGAGGAAVP